MLPASISRFTDREPDLKSGLALLETRPLIEAQSCRVFRTSQKHNFVATTLPCRSDRCSEDGLAISTIAMLSVGDNILDQCIGRAASRQVGNDDESTGADERFLFEANENRTARITRKLLPNSTSILRREGTVLRI